MNRTDFRCLFIEAGFNDEKALAAFFQVSEKTVRNWQKRQPPKAVTACLELMGGKLDCLVLLCHISFQYYLRPSGVGFFGLSPQIMPLIDNIC